VKRVKKLKTHIYLLLILVITSISLFPSASSTIPPPFNYTVPTDNLFDVDEFSLDYIHSGTFVINATLKYAFRDIYEMFTEHIANGGLREEITAFNLRYIRIRSDLYFVTVFLRIGNYTLEGKLNYNPEKFLYYNDSMLPSDGIYAPYIIPPGLDYIPLATTLENTVHIESYRFTEPVFLDLRWTFEDNVPWPNFLKDQGEPYLGSYGCPYVSQEGAYSGGGNLHISTKYNILVSGGTIGSHGEVFLKMACTNLSSEFYARFGTELWQTSLNLGSREDFLPENENTNISIYEWGTMVKIFTWLGIPVILTAVYILKDKKQNKRRKPNKNTPTQVFRKMK
jgi:hypothetical protein